MTAGIKQDVALRMAQQDANYRQLDCRVALGFRQVNQLAHAHAPA